MRDLIQTSAYLADLKLVCLMLSKAGFHSGLPWVELDHVHEMLAQGFIQMRLSGPVALGLDPIHHATIREAVDAYVVKLRLTPKGQVDETDGRIQYAVAEVNAYLSHFNPDRAHNPPRSWEDLVQAGWAELSPDGTPHPLSGCTSWQQVAFQIALKSVHLDP